MNPTTSLADLFDAYQADRSKKLSINTVANYRNIIETIRKALRVTPTVADLSAERVALVVEWMESNERAPRSIINLQAMVNRLARMARGLPPSGRGRPARSPRALPAPAREAPAPQNLPEAPGPMIVRPKVAGGDRQPSSRRAGHAGNGANGRNDDNGLSIVPSSRGDAGRGRKPPRIDLQTTSHDDGEITLEQLFHAYEKKKLRGAAFGTSNHYRGAITLFSRWLRREAALCDLTDDVVTDFMWWAVESHGHAPESAVSNVKKILALWRFACRQGMLRVWPEVELMACPKRDPVAWSKAEMQTIFRALRSQEGTIGRIAAADYWVALLLTFWDTAERLEAVLSLRPEDVNLHAAWVTFRAETRKGKLRDRGMPLNAATVEALHRILNGEKRRLVFEAPFGQEELRSRYKAILRDAGLPYDRKRLFHCIRKTVASHFESLGHDATELLDHSMRKVTTDSYLSPQIVKRSRPADVLFRPEPNNARELSEAEARARSAARAKRFADLLQQHGDSVAAWVPIYLGEAVEDVSAETLRRYAQTVARFDEFLGGRESRLEDLTLTRLLQFAVARIEGGVSEITADRERASLAAIRRFVEEMRGGSQEQQPREGAA